MNDSVVPIPLPGRAGTADLVAGVVCLDFVNTLDPRVVTDDGTIPRNYLIGYNELIAWSQHAEILSASQAQALLEESQHHADDAQTVLERAIKLRETIYEIFFAISQQRDVPAQALETLKHFYAQAIHHAQLSPVEEGFGLVWHHHPPDFMSPLWPIVSSAMELLLRGENHRIKECPTTEGGCGWLFYDTSKNNSRRWCSMRTCGMQSKDRRRGKRMRPSQKTEE